MLVPARLTDEDIAVWAGSGGCGRQGSWGELRSTARIRSEGQATCDIDGQARDCGHGERKGDPDTNSITSDVEMVQAGQISRSAGLLHATDEPPGGESSTPSHSGSNAATAAGPAWLRNEWEGVHVELGKDASKGIFPRSMDH